MRIAKTVFLAGLLAVGLACGYSAKSMTPPGAGAMPNIAALVPGSANAGASLGANGLMVTGTSFNSNATVSWNGTALATVFVNATQLTATVPDADIASAGTATITVTNPGTAGGIYGGGTSPETSNSMTFTIN
jgi:hypothetical protein